MSTSQAIVVLMTAGSHEEATLIADHLVETRVAACVQIIPGVQSVYRWQGEIERAQEILLLAKTTDDKFDQLEAAVRSLHSYTTPEIIALPVTAIATTYHQWLIKNVGE